MTATATVTVIIKFNSERENDDNNGGRRIEAPG